MAELLYQGHGSYRIVSNEGVVIYVDPYAGEGYDMPADIVIVTHEHSDHNQVDLVTLKDDGVILRHGDLFVDGEYPIGTTSRKSTSQTEISLLIQLLFT